MSKTRGEKEKKTKNRKTQSKGKVGKPFTLPGETVGERSKQSHDVPMKVEYLQLKVVKQKSKKLNTTERTENTANVSNFLNPGHFRQLK